MSQISHQIQGSIVINAPLSKVWSVLTEPAKIKLYTGAKTYTDWVVGSAIAWRGEMNGTRFENRGRVLENKPDALLRYTYWSGMGGDPDLPENYSEITYTLKPLPGNSVELTYQRINIATAMEKQIFEAHLPSMLEEIKKLSEFGFSGLRD